MKTNKKKDSSPFSLRLTAEERSQLERQAGAMPLGAFIRDRLLGSTAEPRRTRDRSPVKDHTALAGLVAQLGKSEIGRSLNEHVEAISTGCLLVTPETETALRRAADDIHSMKHMLMAALGVKEH